MESLPDCLLLRILSYVDLECLTLGVRMVNSRFRNLTFDPELWRLVEIPEQFTDARLELLMRQIHGYVESLECGKCEILTADGFLALADLTFPRLLKLALPLTASIPDSVFLKLSVACPNLEELGNVRPALDDSCDIFVAQGHFSKLKVLHDRPVINYGSVRRVPTCVSGEKRKAARVVQWEDGLSKLAAGHPDVDTYICSRGMQYVDDAGLATVSAALPWLRSLQLRHCSVGEDGFRHFFERNNVEGGLRELILDTPGDVSDKSLATIADNCPSLCEIKISRCCLVTGEGIKYLATKCPQLSKLHINNSHAFCENVTDCKKADDIDDDCVSGVAGSCPALVNFRLFYSDSVTHTGVASLVTSCRFLTGLMLFECSILRDEVLERLVEAKFLQALVLVHSNAITPRGLIRFVLSAPTLLRLTFYTTSEEFYRNMFDLTEETYNLIEDETQKFRPNIVKRLTLRGIGSGFLQLLTVLCPELQDLYLKSTCFVNTASLVNVLKSCEMLRYLDVSSVESLGDDFMRAVCQYGTQLRHLLLGSGIIDMNIARITDVIRSCVSLRALSMDTQGSNADETELVKAVKESHGGHCFLQVDPDFAGDPESEIPDRFVTVHFTPLKYLNSIQHAVGLPT